jgi:hypothetical protein
MSSTSAATSPNKSRGGVLAFKNGKLKVDQGERRVERVGLHSTVVARADAAQGNTTAYEAQIENLKQVAALLRAELAEMRALRHPPVRKNAHGRTLWSMQPTIGRWPRNTIALPVCAGHLNLANIIFGLKKTSRHLRIVKNACAARPPLAAASADRQIGVGHVTPEQRHQPRCPTSTF